MRVLFIYYTGTYNTRYLTRKLSEQFVARGHETEYTEIGSDTPAVSTEGYDLIGLGYPIYGFNSPLFFNRYLKKIKFLPNQGYFIYKNSGETLAINNASSRIILRRMKRCGAVFRGEYHFVMPYNIHFPFERDFVREILEKNRKLGEIMIYRLENEQIEEIQSNLIYNIAASAVGIQKIGGNINSFFYRVDSEKCRNCGLCLKNCPRKNIYRAKGGRIRFKHHCNMCMRCSFYCPANAIKIGFLEGWKVNGSYHFEELEGDTSPLKPYITSESSGFYKCFIKYFANIDAVYEKIFLQK